MSTRLVESGVESAAAATIEISGAVTLAEAPRWRDALLAAFATGKPVHVRLANAGPWDLAGLQLLISAVATARETGQALALLDFPKSASKMAERGGLSDAFRAVIASVSD